MDVSYDCALALMRALSEKDMNAFLRLLYDEFHFPCVALDAAHRTIAMAIPPESEGKPLVRTFAAFVRAWAQANP